MKHYKSIFISDLHLGYKVSRSDLVTDFLENHTCENLYLVGDIIDFWELHRKFVWNRDDSLVLRQILLKKSCGTKVFYLVGNHDGIIRPFINDISFEGITFANEIVHEGVDGKRYLVVHGDLFDNATVIWEVISRSGGRAYEYSVSLNRMINKVREWFGYAPASISSALKHRVKSAMNYINKFEDHMVKYCKEKDCDGAICGHIHTATIRDMNGLIYMNCGDWVESYTALVENEDGTFEIVKWNKR
jgi:UDP-2,3-diacylglucosamine pyrophosphatase LpxH